MAVSTVSGEKELDRLLERNPQSVADAILSMVAATISGDIAEMNDARRAFQVLVGEGMALADMLARRRVDLETKAAIRKAEFRQKEEFLPVSVVPAVPFEKAVDDIASRIAMDVPTSAEVARVYIEERGFAVAAKADLVVVKRVQDFIASTLREGVSVAPAARVIVELTGWAQSYAETVYRTNLNSAYTAGRFAQAKDPNIRKVIVGLELVTAGDNDVRSGRAQDHGENHAAADRFRASADDPMWLVVAPPNGYK